MLNLLKKELKDSRFLIIVLFASVFLTSVLFFYIYKEDSWSFISHAQASDTSVESYYFYLWYMSGGSVLTLLSLKIVFLFIVSYLSNILYAKESINNTFQFLYTRPISRLRIFTTKFLTGLLITTIMVFSPILMIPFLELFSDLDFSYMSLFISLIPYLFIWYSILAIGLFISTLARHNRWAFVLTFYIPIIWDEGITFIGRKTANELLFNWRLDSVFTSECWYLYHNIGYMPFIVGVLIITIFAGSSYLLIRKKEY